MISEKRGHSGFFIDRQGGKSGEDAMSWLLMKGKNQNVPFFPLFFLRKRFPLDVGWMRHVVCAVIHRMCRKAHNKKDVVLLRNARWVTQKALTHPTLRLK
jgi:hypothetical protein